MAKKYCAADPDSRVRLIDVSLALEDIRDDAEALRDAIEKIDGEPRHFHALIDDICELVVDAIDKMKVNGREIYDHIDSTEVRDREVMQ